MKALRAAGGGSGGNDASNDNSTEFIEIVKKYDIVYNTHHPDYKNTQVKLKAWAELGEEIGLSVEAAKRKWKNLRDSYTKYLRSFRTGTKTSKKYQYWAHAEHMEFLKPYQGPGRSTVVKNEEHNILFENEEESDLGYQMLAKATSPEDDGKMSTTTTNIAMPMCTTTSASSLPIIPIMSIPTLPKVQLPPLLSPAAPIVTTDDPPQQVPLPLVVNDRKSLHASNTTVGPVGCLIIEPQLYASAAESFKNAISAAAAATTTSIAATKSNPPLITKIRRVQPSQQAPISYATAPTQTIPASRSRKTAPVVTSTSSSAAGTATTSTSQALAPNIAKELDNITSLLQANRDLDSTCLFFLSLAKTVRMMPTKYQSLAKMRCMRIVSDIELEIENYSECNGVSMPNDNNNYATARAQSSSSKRTSPSTGGQQQQSQQSSTNHSNENTEHFLYVMSPSRVEGMIDISSEEEAEGSNVANGN